MEEHQQKSNTNLEVLTETLTVKDVSLLRDLALMLVRTHWESTNGYRKKRQCKSINLCKMLRKERQLIMRKLSKS